MCRLGTVEFAIIESKGSRNGKEKTHSPRKVIIGYRGLQERYLTLDMILRRSPEVLELSQR